MAIQLFSNKGRLESLVNEIPKESKNTDQIKTILRSQQRAMLELASTMEKSNKYHKEDTINKLSEPADLLQQNSSFKKTLA